MKITRRQFMKGAVATGIGMALPLKFGVGTAHAFAQSDPLKKFIQPLRGVGGDSLTGGIPVALPDATPAPVTGVTHYTINIGQFTDRLHPFLPKQTALWGFNPVNGLGVVGTPTPTHLGGIIVAQKGVPIQITFQNGLPPRHIIPVDATLPGANGAQDRTAIHLHGGFVPWISDGGPFDWFDPAGGHGLSFLNNQVLNPSALAGQADYYYPMDQSARLLWYHDHAFGITRINAYAGIASGLVLRDSFEAGLVGAAPGKGLPAFVEKGGFELPIIIQDKIFVPTNITTIDPTWNLVSPGQPGDLWYAHVYDPTRWRMFKGGATIPPPDPSAIPEYFGDTMLTNGTVYPEVTVQARRYRLRILNACNARFLNLQLFVDDGSADGITLDPKTLLPLNTAYDPPASTGLARFSCRVIGAEGGFLPKPVDVPLNVPFNPVLFNGSLLMAPAERADVIIDFTGYAGSRLILYNDAPAPFPVGDPRNDYFPGAPKNPVITTPGFGPNTRQIMRFRVIPASLPADPPLTITTATDLTAGNDPLFTGFSIVNGVVNLPTNVQKVRPLTLNEDFDQYGRLIQRLGTNVALFKGTFARNYIDPSTENPILGTDGTVTEVWEIANLTGDTHPIHFHLVNVQIIARQPFNVKNYNGIPSYNGPARPPDPDEAGWKETVRMNPGEVTTVIMKFILPVMPVTIPSSPRTTVDAAGLAIPNPNEYVWHCHILEHEEHDMMRPLVVSGVNPTTPIPTIGLSPASQGVYGVVGGAVSFTIYGGTPPYSVSPLTFGATIAGNKLTFTVPAGTPAQSMVYTITDSTLTTIGAATLNIV